MSSDYNFIPIPKTKNSKLLSSPECAHLNDYGQCNILRVNECCGINCPFKQSFSKKQSSYEKWKYRLNGLNEQDQVRIAKKYYNDIMQWNKK